MFVGQHYFTIEFNPVDGKFTVKHMVYSGSFIDFHIEQNNLVYNQYSQASDMCDKLNEVIKSQLS